MNDTAISDLYAANYKRMMALASKMGVPWADCEDVVQDAFIGLISREYAYITPGLVALAVVRIAQRWRSSNRMYLCGSIRPDEHIERHGYTRDVTRSLEARQVVEPLSRRDCDMLAMSMAGYTQAEIGAMFDVSHQEISRKLKSISAKCK